MCRQVSRQGHCFVYRPRLSAQRMEVLGWGMPFEQGQGCCEETLHSWASSHTAF
jgi:hypothetical protein